MSQKVRITSARVKGHPFVGLVHPDSIDGKKVEGPAEPMWSAQPETVMTWLCSGYRTRFNQHRAWRGRYAYAAGERVVDSGGEPILVPIGRDPEYLSQSEARLRFPHLAAMPDMVLQAPERLENEEWWSAVKRRATLRGKGARPGGLPGMRSKRDEARFACWFNGGRNAVLTKTGRRSGIVTISGMNPSRWKGEHPSRWQIQLRVRLSQSIRDYTSIRVNWSRRELVFVNEPAMVSKKQNTGTTVGLDLGVKRTIAVSDGTFFDQPSTADLDAKIKHHSRKMAKSRHINNPTGAKNWSPTGRYHEHRAALAEAHRAKKARLDDWRQKVTTELVRTHDLIAVEDLSVKNMTRSARGNLDAPGTNVAAKSGLNRSLAQAAFSTLRAMLAYKTDALIRAGHDQHLLAVNPANTSRRCNPCGHIAAENRESQAVFNCKKCGHKANADTNASGNVLDAALQLWVRTDGTGASKSRRSQTAVDPAGSRGKTNPPAGVLTFGSDGAGDEPRTNLVA